MMWGGGGSNVNPTTTLDKTWPSKDEEASVVEWEMTPSGMLVQKRAATNSASPPPHFRVRVAYGASRHHISVSSQATFGELKKLLTAETGLQPAEQRLSFRGKERKDGSYLDTCGVKDGSKIVLTEDAWSIEKRVIEMQRNAKIQAARQKIEDVSMELDKLHEQVGAIEKTIRKGSKVAEVQITTLIEMLMRQAVKLDNIIISPQAGPAADACALKILQGKKVQKCVETLDGLKISNAGIKPAAFVQTKWESFDLLSPSVPSPPPPTTNPWELFD